MHKYPFIRFAAGVLRVLGWIALVLGVIASIGNGIVVGMTIGQWVDLPFVNILLGAMVIIIGLIGSFLVWLFLLASREVFHLLIDVEQNTRNTAERGIDQTL